MKTKIVMYQLGTSKTLTLKEYWELVRNVPFNSKIGEWKEAKMLPNGIFIPL